MPELPRAEQDWHFAIVIATFVSCQVISNNGDRNRTICALEKCIGFATNIDLCMEVTAAYGGHFYECRGDFCDSWQRGTCIPLSAV